MKKAIACFLLMGVLLGTLGGCKTGDSGLTVLDANGAPVENAAYVQIVQQQVADRLLSHQMVKWVFAMGVCIISSTS